MYLSGPYSMYTVISSKLMGTKTSISMNKGLSYLLHWTLRRIWTHVSTLKIA